MEWNGNLLDGGFKKNEYYGFCRAGGRLAKAEGFCMV